MAQWITSHHPMMRSQLSKLTSKSKVYRGLNGVTLPDSLRVPNEHGIMGGIDPACMSTTLRKEQALFYAKGGADKSKHGKPKILFEIDMGMIDRGADLDWLSMFKGEKEILFGPLTGIELRSARVEVRALAHPSPNRPQDLAR